MSQNVWLFLSIVVMTQTIPPTITVLNKEVLKQKDFVTVLSEGDLDKYFDDTTFSEILTCRNGGLQIVQGTQQSFLSLNYTGTPITSSTVHITVSPNPYPIPSLGFYNNSNFIIDFNCPSNPDNSNYYNKVSVELLEGYKFSFLLNCAKNGDRHKKFEFGYLIISLINLGTIVGVAMYSHIWSIRIRGSLLQLQLRWQPFLIFSIGMLIIIGIFYYFAANQLLTAFVTLRYIGVFASIFSLFICFNEVLFLNKTLRNPFLFASLQRCQTISALFTLGIIIVACFYENWIFYDFLAICICVGAIKLFKFRSLKQAFLSKIILVVTVTSVTIASHFALPQSYNDYAGQLASPLFIQVPDLIDNLYKKCSWLPVLDVILPGLLLSFLRIYDFNKGSKWFGVYTVVGNITFILSTLLWVLIEAVYDFSVPFSLVTYLSLMLIIFVVSWTKNQWEILYTGTFEQQREHFDPQSLQEKNNRFSNLVERDALNQLMRQSSSKSGISGDV